LVVIHFTGGGLVILSDNDTIAGNFIGTDPDGASGLGNYDGISILGNGATVGGANPSDRNVVSGNTHAGIYESTVTSVVIQQNYVGIAPDGSTPLGNGSQGMLLRGSATVDANVVAANGTVTPAEGIGIDVQSSGTYFPAVTMTNNVVGADPSATLPRGNLGGGISNTSSQSVQMNGNTVVSNSHFGIRLLGIGFDLRNDLVGINASGTSMGNDGPGILTSDKPGDFIADLGGTEIAFNSGAGIEMIEEGAGSTADSITFDTYGIGTAIHHNGLAGIRATGPHAQIFPNDVTLYSNGHLGIDLGDNGVTPNDAKDLDDGPDALQNFPLLQGAKATADTIDVKWSINTTPSSTPVVRFYSSPSCDPSGYGEGKTYLGFLDGIVTDANGDADGTMQFGGTSAPAIGSFVTSTSSVDDGFASPPTGISEFSNCVKVRRASTSLSLRVVKKTRNLRAKGALTPLLPGRLISVKLLRKRDGAYKLVAKRTAVTNSLSRFAVGFPRPKAGACKLKAVFKGAERYAASSRSLTFRC
jgi:hypothetical protein